MFSIGDIFGCISCCMVGYYRVDCTVGYIDMYMAEYPNMTGYMTVYMDLGMVVVGYKAR